MTWVMRLFARIGLVDPALGVSPPVRVVKQDGLSVIEFDPVLAPECEAPREEGGTDWPRKEGKA